MSLGSVKGKPCGFDCGRPSSPSGEHVLPRALANKLFPQDEGPYTTIVDGEQTTSDAGKPLFYDAVPKLKLPCCPDCNAALAKRFETNEIQNAVFALFDGAFRRADASEDAIAISKKDRSAVSMWLLKTTLLWHHPEAVHTSDPPGWGSERGWYPFDRDLYSWMVDESEPPDDLSVWATTSPKTSPATWWIPGFTRNKRYTGHHGTAGIATVELRTMYHPGSTYSPAIPPGVQIWPYEPKSDEVTFEDLADANNLWPTFLPFTALLMPAFDPLSKPWPIAEGAAPTPSEGMRGFTT